MRTMAKTVGGAIILLGTLVLTGCGGGPTGPDAATDRTAAGIRVTGAGTELHPVIDQQWAEVVDCWHARESGERLLVSIQQPELLDNQGRGVIRVGGQLVYGLRIADHVWVAPDLGALRHEFSHVVAERVTGRPVENYDGRCWL